MRRAKQPSLHALQAACDTWNLANPIGTDVVVTRDNGKEMATKTRSMAYVLSGHSAMIFLDGISGCYALERVRAA